MSKTQKKNPRHHPLLILLQPSNKIFFFFGAIVISPIKSINDSTVIVTQHTHTPHVFPFKIDQFGLQCQSG